MKKTYLQLTFRILSCITLLISLLLSFDVFAQIDRNRILYGSQPAVSSRHLNERIYTSVVRPDEKVKITSMDGRLSDSTSLSDLRVTSNSRYVMTFAKDLEAVKPAARDVLQNKGVTALQLDEMVALPELYIQGTTGNAPEKVYRVLFTTLRRFTYDLNDGKYKGKIGFFLLDESNAAAEGSIQSPLKMEVTSDEVDAIIPNNLAIGHLNLPSSEINLVGGDLRDSALVRIRTVANPEGYGAHLKVDPSPVLITKREGAQGFGVEKIPVTVGFRGSNSNAVATINLHVDRGSVSEDSITLKLNETRTVYVQSAGTGPATLTAYYANQPSNVITFDYQFPWMFILFALGGGLLGGLTKFYVGTDNKKFSFKPIVGGILVGLIGAIAYYTLGINLLGIDFSATVNEFAILGLSALVAYFGIKRG